MLEHHVPSRKKLFKKKNKNENDNWANRQRAKSKRYVRSKEKLA